MLLQNDLKRKTSVFFCSRQTTTGRIITRENVKPTDGVFLKSIKVQENSPISYRTQVSDGSEQQVEEEHCLVLHVPRGGRKQNKYKSTVAYIRSNQLLIYVS